MNHKPTSETGEDPSVQRLTFILGNKTSGVDVLHGQEELRYTEISPMPRTP
ncbi:MAG: hypothetical protein V3T85_13050 [Acidiferrobacterales bacterium]|jgi:chemotaxis signal transduction protein